MTKYITSKCFYSQIHFLEPNAARKTKLDGEIVTRTKKKKMQQLYMECRLSKYDL